MFDTKCYELAKTFLEDELLASGANVNRLAQVIQTAIEDEIYEIKAEQEEKVDETSAEDHH